MNSGKVEYTQRKKNRLKSFVLLVKKIADFMIMVKHCLLSLQRLLYLHI